MSSLRFAEFVRRVEPVLAAGISVPLVVFRTAPTDGIAAAIRDADAIVGEPGELRFGVAMAAPPRRSSGAPGVDALRRRVAAALAAAGVTERCETGCWTLRSAVTASALGGLMDAALERGGAEDRRRRALATVAHELRTPLGSIRGYIETLLDEELDAATARRFLETARRQALRLGRLVEGMLDVSPLDLHATAAGAACDVAEQLRTSVEAALPIAYKRGVALRAYLPAAGALRARIDGDAFVHAVLNLIDNAIVHGRRGGTIVVRCEPAGASVRVTVDDDGPGIAVCDRERLFALGARGAGAPAGGRGIGLAVVHAIAHRAGGGVRIGDSPLGGARFELRFRAG